MDKHKSRKYMSAWRLTWVVTILLTLPWLAKVFGIETDPIITSDIWSTTVMVIWGSYFTASTAVKGLFAWNNSKSPEPLDPEHFNNAG